MDMRRLEIRGIVVGREEGVIGIRLRINHLWRIIRPSWQPMKRIRDQC